MWAMAVSVRTCSAFASSDSGGAINACGPRSLAGSRLCPAQRTNSQVSPASGQQWSPLATRRLRDAHATVMRRLRGGCVAVAWWLCGGLRRGYVVARWTSLGWREAVTGCRRRSTRARSAQRECRPSRCAPGRAGGRWGRARSATACRSREWCRCGAPRTCRAHRRA